MTVEELMDVIIENDFDVTFTGGDPIYQAKDIVALASEIVKVGKDIWCYTGFRYEDLMLHDDAKELLRYVDVLVDGPFVNSLRDVHLLFRGSSNQRLVDIKKSTPDSVVEWEW